MTGSISWTHLIEGLPSPGNQHLKGAPQYSKNNCNALIVHRFQVKTEKLIVPLKRLETNPFEAICSYGARPILREGRERVTSRGRLPSLTSEVSRQFPLTTLPSDPKECASG
ncbi:hypothetical protein AT2G07636, partial [Arabidopsis thaliana]